ncbi:coniferyl alcohol acyltransferase-like [Lolium rigidum]|uniref:coniferyl alcohol acyltransferase-like n=1 Tax=Lolium rigidum TaxID=89674 RepID=UPI001F5CF29F|nr:coniferyl alcohol acyltransferase-like [Lolium rigidum]
MIANAWSELARSGMIAAAPNLDCSVFRPRAPPTYSSSVGKLFMPLERERLVNALTASVSKVGRTYYVEEQDLAMLRAQAGGRATLLEAVCAYIWKVFAAVVGSSDEKCRMGWWVDGRRRRRLTTAAPAAMRNYVGNVITYAVAEASMEGIRRLPLPGVASMVRESIKSAVNDEHFQELLDWVEQGCGEVRRDGDCRGGWVARC